MKYIKILILAVVVAGLFGIAPRAHAQFNNKTTLRDWTKTEGSISLNDDLNSDDLGSFCSTKLFSFQQDNLFVGTFCDLGSILAISAADFATNVTCTIQKVAMNNYDSSIKFTPSEKGSTGICSPSHGSGTAQLSSGSGSNIFGTGDATGTADGATGFYVARAMSQLSNDINPASGHSWIYTSFRIVRNFATVIALVFLMIFAFANILHIDVNTYTIKKMIPNIIIAVVGAYLSIYVILILSRGIDFLYRLEFFSPYNALHPFYNIMGGNFGTGSITNASGQNQNAMALVFQLGGQLLGSGNTYTILSGILGVILISIPAVVVFAFEYVMALRPIAVGLLIVLSPIAFAAYVFPAGQNIFKKWISITLIALFYAPAVNLILYIINQINPGNVTSIAFVLLLLVKTAIFILLIRLPFTIETDIQKISLALAKTSFGGALGFGKAGEQNIKVKQDNKNTITDQTLGTKEAKSLIAPVNGNYRRLISPKIETDQKKQTMSQIFNRNQGPYIKNLDNISDKAHRNNLARANNLLVNSIVDLPPQALQKIVTSSNGTIFRDTPLINQLKLKNGQLLDDEGAVTRADAAKKVFRSAQLVEQGKIGNPEAIKLLSQKQMLSVLPVEILKKALDQGILTKDNIRANFKGDPDAALSKIGEFNRGKLLSTQELQQELKTDFEDSKSGFTDLLYAISSNQGANLANPNNLTRTLAMLKNQNQGSFERNSLYYLSRLNDVNQASKKRLTTALQQAGTPAQTASAIGQNPSLSYQQISSYIPKTATGQTLSVIRETIAERNNSQAMIKEISSSLKDDKILLGQTIAEKISESLKSGNSRSLDDINNKLSQSLKNLRPDANPQEVKSALSQINSFAPGTAIQTATAPTAEDIEKIKDKGLAVISTINEMKASGVTETTIIQNPQVAAEEYSNRIQKTINDVATGKVKPGQVGGQIETETPNAVDSDKITSNSDQVQKTIGSVISTKAEKGKTFEQTVSDLSRSQTKDQPPQSSNSNSQAGQIKNG